jgi:hypothetical protein
MKLSRCCRAEVCRQNQLELVEDRDSPFQDAQESKYGFNLVILTIQIQ